MVRQSGKVSVLAILVAVLIVGLGVMALSTGESPTATSAEFMGALGAGDEETLAKLSYAPGFTRQEMAAKWRYTTDVVAKYFSFAYEIKGTSYPSKDTAIVVLEYTRDAGSSGSYPERLELSLKKTTEGWKVDAFAIPRTLFPGLPRPD